MAISSHRRSINNHLFTSCIMETKDLRIGNYVSYLGEPQEVLGMDKTQVYIKPFNFVLFLDINEVEPITLTEEWILKLGFEKLCNFRFHINKPANYDGFLFCEGYSVITDRIHYVYQLQNLYFSLTGKELKLI